MIYSDNWEPKEYLVISPPKTGNFSKVFLSFACSVLLLYLQEEEVYRFWGQLLGQNTLGFVS